jgi:predicted  nucleic acid-binding Zn-ribbon protein
MVFLGDIMDTRELDQIRKELDRLHDRTTTLKSGLVSLQTVVEERHKNLIAYLDSIQKEQTEIRVSLDALKTLATEGKTSLKTIFWIGSTVGAVLATIYTILGIYTR